MDRPHWLTASTSFVSDRFGARCERLDSAAGPEADTTKAATTPCLAHRPATSSRRAMVALKRRSPLSLTSIDVRLKRAAPLDVCPVEFRKLIADGAVQLVAAPVDVDMGLHLARRVRNSIFTDALSHGVAG